MPTGISIHIGVNEPNPLFGKIPLNACVNDAKEMQKIAQAHNFETKLFPDDQATLQNIKEAVKYAAGRLKNGDIFLFTFSGHGSTAFREDNQDGGQDESILLRDCVLIDDYIRRVLWSKFDEGVRILGIADCCHAGTALFAFFFGNAMGSFTAFFDGNGTGTAASHEALTARPKDLTPEDVKRIKEATHALPMDIHKQIAEELASDEAKDPKATILTLAACRDSEEALDGVNANDNSAFTKAMLEVLGRREADPPLPQPNNPPKNYDELIMRTSDQLVAKEITTQHPVRSPKQNHDPAFLGQVPFTI